jgi:2-phospho-L-lactate transferase CofD
MIQHPSHPPLSPACVPLPAGPLRKLTTRVSHVLPVSDDGGSTAEIVRVIGGPAVGDIRSRCLRLADVRDEEVCVCVCVCVCVVQGCIGSATESGCYYFP